MVNSLNQKRVLVTDIDFQNDVQLGVIRSLIAEDAIPLVLIPEFSYYDKLAEKFPRALPLLLDVNGQDGVTYATKLFSILPTCSHIFNTNGENFNSSLSKSGLGYKYKTEELSVNATPKEIMKKLTEAGNTSLILNIQSQNSSMNFSAAAIKEKVSTTLFESKNSLRRMFSLGPSPSSSNTKVAQERKVSQSLSSPAVLSQQRKYNEQGTKYQENQSKNLQLENEKMIKVITKLTMKSRKKYSEMDKNLDKKQSSKEKEIQKNITLEMKKEKNHLLHLNAEANAQTLSRSGALSDETANRIVASRNVRVDKEVERNAEKRFRGGKEKIETEIQELKKLMIEMHYKYIVEKQVKKFQHLSKSMSK